MKFYVSVKMIMLKKKMKIKQEEQSYPNVTTRKYVMYGQFINKGLLECFFHSNKINQNSAVVPGNRSHAITTKHDIKVIVVLNSHLGDIVISYQNVEAAWSISVGREQKKP